MMVLQGKYPAACCEVVYLPKFCIQLVPVSYPKWCTDDPHNTWYLVQDPIKPKAVVKPTRKPTTRMTIIQIIVIKFLISL